MADVPRVLEIEDVSLENIAYILSSAGLKATVPGDGSVWILSDNSLPLKVKIVERDKMLLLQSSAGLKDSAPIIDKLRLADELNRAILIRFYVDSDHVLVGDHYISYEYGVLTSQLALTCHLFQHIFFNVLREKFVPNGVLDV